jgi:hypothetical protein
MDTSSTSNDKSVDSQIDRLTVPEAAALLGITQAAIYKRISRGKIEHDKDDDGHVYVYLDTSDIGMDTSTDKPTDGSNDKSETVSSADLIAELKAHNESLRQEVEAWREEARRKDAILMTMAQRIPELEAPREPTSEARESPVTPQGDPTGTPTTPERPFTEKEPRRRSWWRAFFGLE